MIAPPLWVIFRRELAGFFTSMFAYLIAAALLVVTGIMFTRDLIVSISVKPPDAALIPTLFAFTLVFFAPLLTMRLLAEEQREGTLELLLTAPISDGSIVFGKFLGVWAYFSFILALTFIYQLVLTTIITPDIGHAIGAYLGIWLYGGAALAVGLFFSALTENQIAAAFLSMITLLLLWLGDNAGQVISNIDIARVVRALSLQGHFSSSFGAGVVRAEDVAYFAGIIVVMLYATIRVVEANRWR